MSSAESKVKHHNSSIDYDLLLAKLREFRESIVSLLLWASRPDDTLGIIYGQHNLGGQWQKTEELRLCIEIVGDHN